MSSLLTERVVAYIEANGGGQGLFHTKMEGIGVIRSFQEMFPVQQIYRPSLCVVLSGAKEIIFGSNRLVYGAMECLVVSVEVPASGRIIEASEETPYLGVTIELDLSMLHDVLQHIDPLPAPKTSSGPFAFVGKVSEEISDCVIRLLRLSDTPKAIPILYPSIMREICYALLSGPDGPQLCNLALPDSSTERVVQAIYALRTNFSRTMRVEQLAQSARMSPSSFHQHFKAITSMTPLQFQKQLRLLEARRLMVADAASVADAAYKVGYESASQFSREYSRTFGIAPKRDVNNLQRLYDLYGRHKIESA